MDTPGERLAQKQAAGKPHPLDDPESAKWMPMQRRNTAAEIADAVSFLCSERAAAIVGQVLAVDCGISRGLG